MPPDRSWPAAQADLLAAASRYHDSPPEFEKDCRELARLLTGDGGVAASSTAKKANSTVRRWIDRRSPGCGTSTPRSIPKPEPSPLDSDRRPARLRQATRTETARPRPGEAHRDCPRRGRPGATPASNGERRVPEVCVHVDLPTLVDGLHASSICETSNGDLPLPVDTIRRLCLRGSHHPDRVGKPTVKRSLSGREQRVATVPTPSVACDVPHLRPSALRSCISLLSDPPRRSVGAIRPHRLGKSVAAEAVARIPTIPPAFGFAGDDGAWP